MANYFILTLDTTPPANPTLELGGSFSTQQLIQATIGVDDSDTTGYEIKIWGDIDTDWAKTNGLLSSGSTDTELTYENAIWNGFTTVKQLKLSDGDGKKEVYIIVRDDVHNESSQVSNSIILDESLPEVVIIGGKADVDKVSANTAKDTANFSFSVSKDFEEFKVCFVTSASSTHDQGIVIGTANGSVNTSGSAGYEADTNYTSTIKGADLKEASSMDGSKIIKVFVKDLVGNWSA